MNPMGMQLSFVNVQFMRFFGVKKVLFYFATFKVLFVTKQEAKWICWQTLPLGLFETLVFRDIYTYIKEHTCAK